MPFLRKELGEEIAPIKQVISERSFKTGKLLADLCKAKDTPVFKKGEKSSDTNYKSIFPTYILCKSNEYIMVSHLVKHLDMHDFLYDLQNGFRKKKKSHVNTAYHAGLRACQKCKCR